MTQQLGRQVPSRRTAQTFAGTTAHRGAPVRRSFVTREGGCQTGLEAVMKSAPPETKLILVRPPVYDTGRPKPGTPDGAAEAACLKAFTDFAAFLAE